MATPEGRVALSRSSARERLTALEREIDIELGLRLRRPGIAALFLGFCLGLALARRSQAA